MSNRQTANEELNKILQQLIAENPDMRFHQILRNFGFITEGPRDNNHSPTWINEFNQEPEVVLQRVKSIIK